MSRVHLATGVVGPYDAVTGQVLAWHALLGEWGMAGGVHAAVAAPRTPGRVAPIEELEPAAGDLVVTHYSGFVPGMERLLELPGRKLVVYHNITPSRYFWAVEPRVAITCELGRDHLPEYVAAADVTAAVSRFNAGELRAAGAREPRVVPILLPAETLAPPAASNGSGAAPLVLTVGRLAPHKRPDLAIRAFALYQRECEPSARLVCAGAPAAPGYLERLEALVAELGARNVSLPGALPQDELNAAWAQARVFLTLSEHEGFCVPLLEALVAGVPAVARPTGGMPEVGGDAALWVPDDDLAVVAEAIHLAATDDELRAELRARGRRQAERFAPERVAQEVRGAVEAALG